ncbi:MAG: hypothetical protein IKJ06_03675 [Clostridia bacterium]|nr:hypothetical protein [Clostridia bacterium]
MKIFKFTQFLGILLVFFAAGSSDLGTIDFSALLQQVATGFLVAGISKLLYLITTPRKKSKAEIIPIQNLRKAV